MRLLSLASLLLLVACGATQSSSSTASRGPVNIPTGVGPSEAQKFLPFVFSALYEKVAKVEVSYEPTGSGEGYARVLRADITVAHGVDTLKYLVVDDQLMCQITVSPALRRHASNREEHLAQTCKTVTETAMTYQGRDPGLAASKAGVLTAWYEEACADDSATRVVPAESQFKTIAQLDAACQAGDSYSCAEWAVDSVRAASSSEHQTAYARSEAMLRDRCKKADGFACLRLANSIGKVNDFERGQLLQTAFQLLEPLCWGTPGDGRACRGLAGLWLKGREGSSGKDYRCATRRACNLGEGFSCSQMAHAYDFGDALVAWDQWLALNQRSCDLGNSFGCSAIVSAAKRRPPGFPEDIDGALYLKRSCEYSRSKGGACSSQMP